MSGHKGPDIHNSYPIGLCLSAFDNRDLIADNLTDAGAAVEFQLNRMLENQVSVNLDILANFHFHGLASFIPAPAAWLAYKDVTGNLGTTQQSNPTIYRFNISGDTGAL